MKNVSKNLIKNWFTIWGINFAIALIVNIILFVFATKLSVIICASICGGVLLIWLAFIMPVYNNYKYCITDDKIKASKGVIFKFNDIIPIIRVQHAELNQGPIDRIFKICSIQVFTAGSTHRIVGIDFEEGEKLLENLKYIINEKVKLEAENE